MNELFRIRTNGPEVYLEEKILGKWVLIGRYSSLEDAGMEIISRQLELRKIA